MISARPTPGWRQGRVGSRHGLGAALCALLWLAAAAAAATLDPSALKGLNRQAEDLFRRANQAAASHHKQALDLYQKAVLRFERIARDGKVENGKLYYNIGNCYFRMKDLGRAILNYRRAQQYIPNDPNLLQNLQYARSRRLDKIETPQRTRVLRTLLFWHYDLSLGARAVIFASSFVAVWLLATCRLFVRRASLGWALVASCLIAAVMLGSLTAEEIRAKNSHPGVIIQSEVTARKGDGTTYEPSFKEPLHPGTEFNVLEDRTEWLQIELMDGRRCWIPAGAGETVHP